MSEKEAVTTVDFPGGQVTITQSQWEKVTEKTLEYVTKLRDGALEGKYNPLLLIDFAGTMEWCRNRALSEICKQHTIFTKHPHKCEKCSEMWEHDPMDTYFAAEGDDYEHSHDCPKCGHVTTQIHYPERGN